MNLAANSNEPVSSKKTSAGSSLLLIKSVISVTIFVGLILMILHFFFSRGTFSHIVAGILAVSVVLNLLLDKRKRLTKNNLLLLVLAIVVAVLASLGNALRLDRPLTYTKGFFNAADVDYHIESVTDNAMFRIELTTGEFEKLDSYYRKHAHERLDEGSGGYGWGYFELDPSTINRQTFSDMKREPLSSRLEKMENTDSAIVESYRIKRGIENLMEGFPEFGEELGRCRAIFWNSPEVTREFYWFEKQQKGYIIP